MKEVETSDVGLSISRNPDETWRECAERYARKYHLQEEVLEAFDRAVASGENEGSAAWGACYEWDILDFVNEKEKAGG